MIACTAPEKRGVTVTGRERSATYKDVYQLYADRIDSGQLQPGDRLPSSQALEEQHHISHATATKVYFLLQILGYTYATPRGTFVADTRQGRLLERLCGALNDLESEGQGLQLEVGDSGSCILGRDGGVCWNPETKKWEIVSPQ